MTTVHVLIPAAKLYAKDCNPPFFHNITKDLCIDYICSFYKSHYPDSNLSFYLGINSKDKNHSWLKFNPFSGLSFVYINNSDSVYRTIFHMLDAIQEPDEKAICIINPITTIPSTRSSDEKCAFFIGAHALFKEDWSSVELCRNSVLFHSKHEALAQIDSSKTFPLTGRIIAQIDILKSIIRSFLFSQIEDDLIFLAEKIYTDYDATILKEEWFDLGHKSTARNTHLKFTTSRFFNQISFDEESYNIIKTSSDLTKLSREGEYYRNIPDRVKHLYPHIISSQPVGDRWELRLEYISLPSLTEMYLYNSLTRNDWSFVLTSLDRVFQSLYSVPAPYIMDVPWLYADKLVQRHEQLLALLSNDKYSSLKFIYSNDYIFNGQSMPPLMNAFADLESLLRSIQTNVQIHWGHGDLCFNNILIDTQHGTIKLIDPKAHVISDDNTVGLVDKRYDSAKLAHSFLGDYDSVVNNLFLIRVDTNDFTFEAYRPIEFDYIRTCFMSSSIFNEIKDIFPVLLANLFLSMLPLHADSPERMLAFGLIANRLLHRSSYYL